MNTTGRKIILAICLILCAVTILMTLYWDSVVMFIAPKTVLTSAITDVYASLKSRFSDSPLWLIAKGYDEKGCNTIQMKLDTSNEILGDISYKMMVQTDMKNQQILAEGVASTQNADLDMSVYLNSEFIALTSEDLLDGGFYGITYDTFAEDLHHFPMIEFLIPNATIRKWDESLQVVQQKMSNPYELPEIPDITEDDMRMLLLGVLALKSEVSKNEFDVNGQRVNGYQITYSERGEKVQDLLQFVLKTQEQEGAEIIASFYLFEKRLSRVELHGISGAASIDIDISLGTDVQKDDLLLKISKTENGVSTDNSIMIRTGREEDWYHETIVFNGSSVSYDWHPENGDMILYLPGKDTIRMQLYPCESGFQLHTLDFAEIIGFSDTAEYDCVMKIEKGSYVEMPGFKNLDKWSFQDFTILLTGIGSLLGIQN